MAEWGDSDPASEDEQVELDQINEAWLQFILSEYHAKQVELTSFEITPKRTDNESVLSTIIGVKVKYTVEGCDTVHDLSVIVKKLPKDPFSRFVVTAAQFDLREIKFYKVLMPDFKEFQEKQLSLQGKSDDKIKLSVPLCYHADYRPADGADDIPIRPISVLVLDDLRASGFSNAKFREGLTLDQTKIALEAIARIHAHSLAMKVIDNEEPLYERYPFLFQTAKATDSYQQLVERGLPQLADFLERTPGLEAVLEALLVLRPRTKHIISALLAPEEPLALITHTDFWCSNLLFREGSSGLECCILDWQMVTYSRPTNDVALLLVSSISTELRRNHTEELLDTYWNSLVSTTSQLGVDIPKTLGYTREDLNKDYKRSQLLALLLCIGSVDVALGTPETEQRLIDVLKDFHEDGVLIDESTDSVGEGES